MVQTPFTWRYGGHQVFLSGSFDGWTERIPMTLIDGSEAFFQRTIDLPPGRYQYKFLVDGTWQVDQHQSCEADEYGIISNIVLVGGNKLRTRDNANTAEASTSRMNTSVMPNNVGSSIDSLTNEPIHEVSDAEMDVLREVLSRHVLSSTTYELIPVSGKVVALDVDVDIEQAFRVMYEQGLAVVPLWDDNQGQLTGMLTVSDFILVLLQLHSNHIIFANQELERRTVSFWKTWKLQHLADIYGTFQRRPLIHAGPDESLRDIASRMLLNNVSAIPIVHSIDGESPRLLHIACLAGILESICRHFRNYLGYTSLLQKPIGNLPVGTWSTEGQRTSGRPILTLHPNDSLSTALDLLLKAQISAVPIVDKGGSLLDVYSKSDITSLARDNLYTRIQLNHTMISQALELTNVTGRNRYHTCNRFDSFYRIMELLSVQDVRRVIVIEASSRRVEGIITLRDVFNFFSR